MKPADGRLEWRIHYYDDRYGSLDRPIRFYQAEWARHPLPFRFEHAQTTSELNPIYLDLIDRGLNTVITAHLNYWKYIDDFAHKAIVEQDQTKIHLYSKRTERVWQDLRLKRNDPVAFNLFHEQHLQLNQRELSRSDYAIHIDIELAWRSWAYMQECMILLGIDLSKDTYDQYLTFIDNLED
jgi:hypothetical protein